MHLNTLIETPQFPKGVSRSHDSEIDLQMAMFRRFHTTPRVAAHSRMIRCGRAPLNLTSSRLADRPSNQRSGKVPVPGPAAAPTGVLRLEPDRVALGRAHAADCKASDGKLSRSCSGKTTMGWLPLIRFDKGRY